MFKNRTFQVKMLKDSEVTTNEDKPPDPEQLPEAVIDRLVEKTATVIVATYAACRSIDFFFKMAEHTIVRKYGAP